MTTFNFSVDSALLGELGERLVSTVHVALAELVKNSYDADANEVKIIFDPETNQGPKIQIIDDGIGMTQEDVRRFWMKIGTTNKVDQPFSLKYGRPRTGAKGIGRFCCRRLGRKLKMTTCALVDSRLGKPSKLSQPSSAKYEITEIFFDWMAFVPGTDVEAIDCQGSSKFSSVGIPGTILEIWGAPEDEWGQGKWDHVRRQLTLLASNRGAHRSGYSKDKGFNIKLKAPGFEGGEGDLRDQLIDATWGTLTAEIDATGHAKCTLVAKGLGSVPKTIRSRQTFPLLKGVELKVGIMPLDRRHFRNPKILGKASASEIATAWGGVQLRYNGFRILPYGDDDWLEIETDRARRMGSPKGELLDFASSLRRINPTRSLLNMLSMRGYLGTVDTDGRCEGLIQNVDRQGLIETDTFQQLKAFVRYAIDWSSIYRDFYLQTSLHQELNRTQHDLSVLIKKKDLPRDRVIPEAVKFLKKEFKRVTSFIPEEEQIATQRALIRTVEAIEARAETDEDTLRRLRLLASTSTLTLLFAHEVKSFIGNLNAHAQSLKTLASEIKGSARAEILRIAGDLSDSRGRFSDLIEMTGIVSDATEGDNIVMHNLINAIKRSIKCFSLISDKYGIEISSTRVPKDYAVGPILAGELYAILINALSNAIKSVIASGNKKLIEISANKSGKYLTIDIKDTGIGLSEDKFEEVFTAFVTDPTGDLYDGLDENLNPDDHLVFGRGTGLGLSIMKDIALSRDGNVIFCKPTGGWKAHLQITLP